MSQKWHINREKKTKTQHKQQMINIEDMVLIKIIINNNNLIQLIQEICLKRNMKWETKCQIKISLSTDHNKTFLSSMNQLKFKNQLLLTHLGKMKMDQQLISSTRTSQIINDQFSKLSNNNDSHQFKSPLLETNSMIS